MAERVEGHLTVEEFEEKVRRSVEAYRQMLERNRERARTGGTDPAATQRARTGLIRPTTTATGTSSHRDTTSEPARTRGSGTTTRQTLLTSSYTQQDRTGRIPPATRVEGLSTVEEFKEKVRRTVEAYRQMLERNRERARTGGTDPAATQRARTGLIRPTTTATGTSSHRDTTSEPARTSGSGTTTRQTLLTSSFTQQDRTGRIPPATRAEGLSTVEEFKEKVRRSVEAYRQMLERNRERARTGGTDPAATQRARTGLIRPTTTATGTSSHRDTTSEPARTRGSGTTTRQTRLTSSFTQQDRTGRIPPATRATTTPSCMDTTSEDEGILTVADVNTTTFVHHLLRFKSVREFLYRKDQEHMVIRSVNVNREEQNRLLQIEYDIDGVVVELQNVTSILMDVYYMTLLPKGMASLLPMYPILKKHVRTWQLGKVSLEILQMCLGFQIFAQGGWSIVAALVPKEKIPGATVVPPSDRYMTMVLAYFQAVKDTFKSILTELPPEEKQMDTLLKNNLSSVDNMRILPKDQWEMFRLLDMAFDKCTPPIHHRLCFVAHRFGERECRDVDYLGSFMPRKISNVSVHAAATLRSSQFHVLLSRTGLQEVIGRRGILRPVLTLDECASYQSNVDHRPLDIGQPLANILQDPSTMTFIQCYVDSPHMRCDAVHPVSGMIGACDILHHNVQKLMQKRAAEYISVNKDNLGKIGGKISSRIEAVVRLEDPPTTLSATDILSSQNLQDLLERHAIVVPFCEEIPALGEQIAFLTLVKDIAGYMQNRLQELVGLHEGMGTVIPTWEAYQLEMALDLLWHGRHHGRYDRNLCRMLGPGAGADGSLTSEAGFLRLTDVETVVSADRSPPPVRNWTTNTDQVSRIQRIFGVGDLLSHSDTVLGTRLLLLLFEDLKAIRSDLPAARELLADMRRQDTPYPILGYLSVSQLLADLSQSSKFRFPFAFGRGVRMAEGRNRDVKKVLQAGIDNLRLIYFPCYRMRASFAWIGTHVFQIGRSLATQTHDMNAVMDQVVAELEAHQLVFRTKLQGLPIFPWIPQVYQRLQPRSFEEVLKALTFVSAVCLLQNHWYVNYRHIMQYKNAMSIDQKDLQRRKILSAFILKGVVGDQLYRVHEDIRYHLQQEEKKITPEEEEEEDGEENQEEAPPVEPIPRPREDEGMQDVIHSPCKHLPARSVKLWTTEETAILTDMLRGREGNLTIPQLYQMYVLKCKDLAIPDRSFHAFDLKWRRLQRKE